MKIKTSLEEALRESEERMRSVLETSPVGIAIYDETGQCFIANDSLAKMIGATKEQVLQQNYNDIESWKTSGTLDIAKSAIKENRSKRHKIIGKLTFGHIIRLDCYLVPFSSGRLLFMAHDITKRILAEEALQQKTHELGERVKELNCLYSISSLVEKPDVSLDEILQDIVDIIPPSWQYPEVTCSRILLNGKEYETENFKETNWKQSSDIFIYGDLLGSLEVCYLEEKPEIDEGPFLKEERNLINAITEQLGYIIERIRTKEEREKLKAKLQHAQKMDSIGTLAGGIAHDFNNILSAIIGYADIALVDVPTKTSLYDNLQKILQAGDRAKDLVKQILAFSRQSELESKPIQIQPIVREVLKLLRASLPSTIEIRQDIQSDSTIMADSTQIHQVLMNLCVNSGYAMQEKGGILDLKITDVNLNSDFTNQYLGMKPGTFIKLTVSDTGHGMSHEIIERIFDPFFTTKKKGEGTGMGLSVVHGIIKSHRGLVTVDSKQGKGSTFNIYIPVIEGEVVPEVESIKDLPVGTERILFVDDEEFQVDIGRQVLERLGYKVVTRTSSVEAFKLFQTKPNDFDLAITDMTMPNMTGDTLAQKIMSMRPEIPIILCTGYSERITEEKAKYMGIKGFVMKPILMREIANIVRKALDEH